MQSFYQFLIEATPPPTPSGPPKDSKGPPPSASGSKGGLPPGFGSGMPPGLGGGPPIGLGGGGGPPMGAPSLGGIGGVGDPANPNPTPSPKVQDLKTLNVFKSLEKTIASRQKSKN